VATGSGGSFGEALRNLINDFGGGGRKKTYRAKGWAAQLRKLNATKAGRALIADLGVTDRTLKAWFGGRRPPSAGNRARIGEAYRKAAGEFPWDIADTKQEITGEVRIGDDLRFRGRGKHSPLRIGENLPGDWRRIADSWEQLGPAEDLEAFYVADVVDIDTSGPIEFPGTSYSIETY
jgi:hypothetical protein